MSWYTVVGLINRATNVLEIAAVLPGHIDTCDLQHMPAPGVAPEGALITTDGAEVCACHTSRWDQSVRVASGRDAQVTAHSSHVFQEQAAGILNLDEVGAGGPSRCGAAHRGWRAPRKRGPGGAR